MQHTGNRDVQVLESECPALCGLLARTLPRKNMWHHPGYRYCIRDDDMSSVR